jgi:hypothetical protein
MHGRTTIKKTIKKIACLVYNSFKFGVTTGIGRLQFVLLAT